MGIRPYTILEYRKLIKKPKRRQYSENPQTIGEHLRKARVTRGLLQRDVATIIGVSEDCLTYWENERSQPQPRHYPAIISFLGYYPFAHETETLGGKIRQIRYCMGLGRWKCAALFHVSFDAIWRWEGGAPMLNPKLRAVIENVWQGLPNRDK